MRTGVNMTIQDYFKRSGINTRSAHSTHNAHGVNEKDSVAKTGGTSFLQTLEVTQSSADSQLEHQGLSLRDYVARPVQVIRSTRTSPRAPKGEHLIPQAANTPLRFDTPLKNTDTSALHGKTIREEAAISENDQILKSINEAADKYNLSPSLIRAVVQAESDYQVRAVSPAGAQGLMQLMPATARELGVQNPFDIGQNINGGAKYLRKMLDQFDGDIQTALSAYNAGPGTVSKFNGNVPYTETRNYVERVMRFSRQFS